MGLWDLLNEEENTKEEVKEAEVVEEKPAVEPKVEKQATEPQKQAVEQATTEKAQREASVDTENESVEKQATPKKKKTASKKEAKKGEHLYPFSIYSEGRIIDISNYGFVPGETYKEDEITKIMFQHQHYEFAGKMEYSFIEEDNVLVVSIAQHRKG